VDAFIVGLASEVIINPSNLELAVRNIRRRADDLSLPREIRNRLVDSLKNGLTNSVNPIFLPLFYESYDNNSGLSRDKLSSLFDYLSKNTLVILDNPLAVNQAIQNAGLHIDKLLFKTKNSGKFYLEKENTYVDPTGITSGLDRFGQVSLTGLNLDQEPDGAVTAVSFDTHQYLCTGELFAGEIKEDAYLRWTAEKIKSWLSEDMFIFLFCPAPEALQRMKHLLLSYDLPVQISSSGDSVLEIIDRSQGNPQLVLLEG
jgi:transcription-repair coupling factor (superfamily II helicase)